MNRNLGGFDFLFFARTRVYRVAALAAAFAISAALPLHAAKPKAQTLSDLQHKDSRKKLAAIEALGKTGDRSAGDALVRSLKTETDAHVRLAVLDSLAQLGDATRVAEVRPLLNDPLPAIRQRAANVLSVLGGPAAEEALLDRLDREPNAQVKAAMVGGLSTCASGRSLAKLQSAESDSDPAVRSQAREVRRQLEAKTRKTPKGAR